MEVKSVAMCPPKYFTVEYKINPWMGGSVDRVKAQDQWDQLKSTIQKCGVEVKEMEPVEGLPDMVFCCNSGIVYGSKVYLSKFHHPERTGEESHYKKWFEDNGYEVFQAEKFFEGGGDAVFSSANQLWAGYGVRSEKEAYIGAQKLGNFRTVYCQIRKDSPFYHFDTCFCPLSPELALWYPEAFEKETQDRMRSEIQLISVSEKEANMFACNSICLGNTVLSPPECIFAKNQMEKLGYRVIEVEMSEFMKSGGACQCLVLKLS